MNSLKTVSEAGDLKGKYVFLRVDFNVPVKDGEVKNTYRIEKSRKTIDYCRDAGAKVILTSHFKGPDNNSLRTVADYVNKYIFSLSFVPSVSKGAVFDEVRKMNDGEVILLENLRLDEGEKSNDDNFARDLASLADVYVNDAFSVSHRAHASVIGVPKYLPAYAGFRFKEEVERLSEAFSPPKPFLFLLGGAKFETKIPLIEKFLDKADTVFLGGALANNVFKEKGLEIGQSVVSDTDFEFGDMIENEKLMLPEDVVIETTEAINPGALGEQDKIMDAGPKTIEKIKEKLIDASFVLWNGPLGDYESGFKDSTLALAKAVAGSPAESIVGGGDTLAAIEELDNLEEFSFVSTGGGAMLHFLVNETLPGIEALHYRD